MRKVKLQNQNRHFTQALNDADPDSQDKFCKWYQNGCDLSEDSKEQIIWINEAQFKVNGSVNEQLYLLQLEDPYLMEIVPMDSSGVPVFVESHHFVCVDLCFSTRIIT